MTSRDHERFRRQLEKQLRADVELLYGAYCAKLRAYETMHRLHGDLDLGGLDPHLLLLPDLPPSLPAAPPPDPAPAPSPAPAAPAPAPAPAPRRRSADHELYDAVQALLDQLPEFFTRREVCAALGYEPRRASLHQVLRSLTFDGWLQQEERGEGRLANVYRKVGAAVPEASDPADET
jgi:hypothetical protein